MSIEPTSLYIFFYDEFTLGKGKGHNSSTDERRFGITGVK